jgi:hypothetical protein
LCDQKFGTYLSCQVSSWVRVADRHPSAQSRLKTPRTLRANFTKLCDAALFARRIKLDDGLDGGESRLDLVQALAIPPNERRPLAVLLLLPLRAIPGN